MQFFSGTLPKDLPMSAQLVSIVIYQCRQATILIPVIDYTYLPSSWKPLLTLARGTTISFLSCLTLLKRL